MMRYVFYLWNFISSHSTFQTALRCFLLAGLLFSAPFSPTQAQADERITFLTLLESLVSVDEAYRAPTHRVGMFSSFDRDGGAHDDQGYIRREGDDYVIAEIQGPGAITRMWTSSPSGQVRLYVDNGSSPLIQRDWWDLFQGKVIPFQEPFVKASVRQEGAHWSYVPIPFADFCKIVLTDRCHYQIEYVTFPVNVQVEPLRIPFPQPSMAELRRIANRFTVPDDPSLPEGDEIETHRWRGTIPAGETIVLATFEGPGVIQGIRMRWPEELDAVGRDLLLQAYWDGKDHPAVLSPVFDFFGGRMRTQHLGRSAQGWGYCFFPMPFLADAKFVLENGNLQHDYEIEFEAAVRAEARLLQPLRRFNAYWRHEIETPIGPVNYQPDTWHPLTSPNRNFGALDLRGMGHWVGVTLHRTPCRASDSMVFLDQSEWPPTMPGTGRNGYFNLDGSGVTENAPLSAGGGVAHNVEGMIRLLGPYAANFRSKLQVGFEHGHANMLRQSLSATTYWYQESTNTPMPWPLPAPARRFRSVVSPQSLYVHEGNRLIPEELIEAETADVLAVGGIFEPTDMRPYGPDWSGAQTLRFEGAGLDAFIEFDAPPLDYSGFYHFKAWMARSPDSAIVQALVDAQEIAASVDLYHEETEPYVLETQSPLFLHVADALRVKFVVAGQNPESNGYVINVDRLAFIAEPVTPSEAEIAGPFKMTPAADSDANSDSAIPLEGVRDSTLRWGYGDAPEWQIVRAANRRIPTVGPDDAIVAVRWRVHAKRSGIYRFEVDPAGAAPFLLREGEQGLEPLPNRILINGIPLQCDGTIRIDPATLEHAPPRFILPLREGENELLWLTYASEQGRIQPKIYGLE